MGFEDRDYYREGPTHSNPFLRGLLWLVNGSVPLFTAWGIHVRAHATMLLFLAFTLLSIGEGYRWQDRFIAALLLFGIVLLHEFGHCFGARKSGGDADQIVMHPLGGLALTQPAPSWQSHLITVAAGPAVNVVICILCGIVLYALRGQVPWKPYFFGSVQEAISFRGWFEPAWLMYWTYQMSWFLLLFNLLPIFPLDGGRLLQAGLWPKLGYYRSMSIATNIGIVGGIGIIVFGIAARNGFTMFIGLWGLMTCLQQRQQLKEMGPYGFSEMDDPFSQAMLRAQRENRAMNRRKSQGPTRAERRAAKKAEQDRAAALAEEAEIDRILAKVSSSGMHSLSRGEQNTLKRATERKQTGRR